MEERKAIKTHANAGQNGKKDKKQAKPVKSTIFFISMLGLYSILYLISPEKMMSAIQYVAAIVWDILPILVLVYLFMFGMSFLNEKKLKKNIERAPSLVKYILMSLLGTLSHGPIYAWYPFLNDLHDKGISKGNVAAFLYARGIKLTLLPMLVAFFDLKYAVVLTSVTFSFAIIQGFMMDLTSHSDKA